MIHEHHDISMFYRGFMLIPLYFNTVGTVNLDHDVTFPIGGGRLRDYDRSIMDWRSLSGTDLLWSANGSISGTISASNATTEDANWSSATLANFKSDIPEFWKYPAIDWSQESFAEIEVEKNSDDYHVYQLPLNSIQNIPAILKRSRIQFLGGKYGGQWEIDYIHIK